jgi:hypothetical protein
MQWRVQILTAVAATALSAGDIPAAVPDAGRRLDFTVLRNGEEVGHDRIDLDRRGPELKVKVETRVVVRIAFVPVYRFEHDGTESWRDGQLVSLSSDTNDDGKRHRLSVTSQGNRLRIESDGSASEAEPGLIPASLWNDQLVRQSVLLNTIDGSRMSVAVARLGAEPVEVGRNRVQADHYRITGALNRDLWYTAEGELVRVAFDGSDGSHIAYVLR